MRPELFRSVYINLGDLGAPGYHALSQLQMSLLYRGAVELIDTHTEAEQLEMLEETEQNLLEHATTGGDIDSEWVAVAVMVKAVRGILYGEIPDCIFEAE